MRIVIDKLEEGYLVVGPGSERRGYSSVDEVANAVTGLLRPARVTADDDSATSDDGWIEWNGGKFPVEPETHLELKFNGGLRKETRSPEIYSWGHDESDKRYNIVAYRLLNDGWIEWNGGECPVEPDLRVGVKLRDGKQWDDKTAEIFRWNHVDNSHDIIAYRVVK